MKSEQRVAVLAVVLAMACSVTSPAPLPHDPLPNLFRLSPGVLSGGVPRGEAGFDRLVELGVKTVISVDGATPDVARAKERGLRYVHVPITYSQVSDTQRLEIARAIRDLPGPVYIHCHHGKHRSPAASAAAGVALGLVTPAQGLAFMRQAGTAPGYEGLYASVACAHVATPIELDAVPAELPAVRKPDGIVAAMIEAEQAFDLLSAIAAAGWTVPDDHPDLVPAAEAGRLTEALRLSAEDTSARSRGAELMRRLADSAEMAAALEEAIVSGEGPDALDLRRARVENACSECHRAHRDKR